MQKQTIVFKIFLALQNTNDHIEIGIFEQNKCLGFAHIEKKNASKDFLVILERLLKEVNIPLSALEFCLINQGPSPFTLLRTTLSYANGLHAALQIPLAGISNFLVVGSQNQAELANYNILILQNAFMKQLYYYYNTGNKNEPIIGCDYPEKIQSLIIADKKMPLIVIGNGYLIYENELSWLVQPHIIIKKESTNFSPITFFGSWGYDQIIAGSIPLCYEPIMPLYFKQPLIF